MPLPLFLGIAAAIAGAGGVGSGIYGAHKMVEANKTMKSAEERHDANMKKFNTKNTTTTKQMDCLGEKEMKILSTFEKFSDLFEQIKNRPEFDEVKIGEVSLPKYNGEELKKVSIGACALVSGLGGAALGTAGGFAAAGATTAAVMALGTASTGTAIASLSGAAATNATLAALGGGSLAIGGGGIALGTTMLGVATAGVGLLVGGVIFSLSGKSISNKADDAYDQMLQAEKQINSICNYLDKLMKTAKNYYGTLSAVENIYNQNLNNMDDLITKRQKIDWNEYSENEKMLIQNTVLLVGLLYKMCKVKLVLTSNEKDGINSINNEEINSVQTVAQNVLRDISEIDIQNIDGELSAIAMVAVVRYFSLCDDNSSDEEELLLNKTVEALKRELELSEKSVEMIDRIARMSVMPFSELKSVLDLLEVQDLSVYKEAVNTIVNISDGINAEEKKALKQFEAYIKFRINNKK